jgi:hypothetical protein
MLEMKEDVEKHNVCSKCKLLSVGITNSIVIDSYCIEYNPLKITSKSKYAFPNLSFGSSSTEFCSIFKDRINYVEMSNNDIQEAFGKLDSLGKPCNSVDKEAYDETLHALQFMKIWSQFEKIRIIMQYDD